MEKFAVVAVVLVFILFAGCANQIPPSGGEVDMIPPEITGVEPEDGTTLFDENSFIVKFDEYIDKSSLSGSIFISPEIEGTLEYDWSGKSVRVSWESELRENTTYTVTIGTDVKDLNNKNSMADPYTFAFSTGEKIDYFQILGKVYDPKPEGIIILAYKNPDPDTLTNPMTQKPDYISQAGKNGRYRFTGLGIGTYRVFAVRDEFRDYLYQTQQDAYGAPFIDINLNEEDSVFIGMDFILTQEDTSAPGVINVTMTDKYHALVEFSEFIDSSAVTENNFYFYDSTGEKRYEVSAVFPPAQKRKSVYLVPADSLPVENEVYLVAEGIPDPAGNVSGEESTLMAVSDRPDTTGIAIDEITTRYQGNVIDFLDPFFTIKFNDAIASDIPDTTVQVFTRTGNNKVPVDVAKVNPAELKISSPKQLEPKSSYEIRVALDLLSDAAGNRGDSTVTKFISTINNLDFSGVSGTIENIPAYPVKVVIENTDNKKVRYSSTLTEGNGYNIERVVPGKYLLWSYIDSDTSESYSHGSVYPFEPAEVFQYFPDTLNLRARWPVGEVDVRYKEFEDYDKPESE